MEPFVVTTHNGSREWQADDFAHAEEQHNDAFCTEPGEQIIRIERKPLDR